MILVLLFAPILVDAPPRLVQLVVVRSTFWGRWILDQLAFLPHAIPGIVFGLAPLLHLSSDSLAVTLKAGGGRGSKDMVILPYKDRLLLFSRYLQQLVMESLGKEKDLHGNVAHQGIAVYGNKAGLALALALGARTLPAPDGSWLGILPATAFIDLEKTE